MAADDILVDDKKTRQQKSYSTLRVSNEGI